MKRILLLGAISVIVNAQSLQSVVNEALSNSTAIKKAKLNLMLSSIKRQEAKANRLGELNLVGSATHYNTPRTLSVVLPGSKAPIYTTRNIYSVGVNYSVALFTGFAQTRAIKMSELVEQMSQAKIKLAKEEIAYNIKALYLNALSLKHLISSQKAYVDGLKRLSNRVKLEVDSGAKAKIDYYKALSEYQMAKADLINTKANLDMIRASIYALSGVEVKRFEDIKIRVKKPRVDIESLASLTKIKMEEIKVKKADVAIKKAKSALYPQVKLEAYAGKNMGIDRLSDGWRNSSVSQVSLKVSYNLFDGGKRKSQIEEAKVAKMVSSLDKLQTIRDLKKLLRETKAKLNASYYAYRANLSSYTLAKKALKVEEVLYKEGRDTIDNLIIAKSKALLSKAKLISSKYEYKKYWYKIDYLLEKGVR